MQYNIMVNTRLCRSRPIDLLHKSHNAPVPYPTMHHFVTEMCTYTSSQNCVVADPTNTTKTNQILTFYFKQYYTGQHILHKITKYVFFRYLLK